jgi:hypothetical protein
MNNQELFNKAYVGLAWQGFEQSISVSCLYRGPNGRKCGIGQAIPDELYVPEMDSTFYALDKVPALIGFKGELELAAAIQQVHDGAESPEGMRVALFNLAVSYGLTVPDVEGV